MPGLTFQSQNSRMSMSGGGNRMPGGWIAPIILIVLSVALITLSVRAEGGVFETVRSGVQSVTKPVAQVCSSISEPFKALGNSVANEEVQRLESENEQLKTLVAELEEYRQQNQRLAALVQLADTYALARMSASVTGVTSGWSRTSTIDKGSEDGVRAGMGVISSCGLYGQVESVTPTTSTVRLATDSNSSVAAMIQGSRAHGILRGSYDGALTLEYVSVEYTVGEGDFVITSGDGGIYPNGIIIGTVKSAEPDPTKLYYRISIDPIFNLASCQEVFVLTGDESEVASLIDEDMLQAIKNSMVQANSESAASAVNAARTGTSETFTADSNGEAQAEDADASSGTDSSGGSSTAASSQDSPASESLVESSGSSSDSESQEGEESASDGEDAAGGSSDGEDAASSDGEQ